MAKWEEDQFFQARIRILMEKLNEANRARLAAMSYDQQCAMIAKLIKKGLMV